MMTNEEYKRQNLRLLASAKEARSDGKFCSIVTRQEKGTAIPTDFLLSLEKSELRLVAEQKELSFCVALSSLQNVRWSSNNENTWWIELKFEVADESYRLHFWSPTEFRRFRITGGSLMWFLRVICRAGDLQKANFAEAEKWRAVFPDAEFPDTEIKNV